MCSNTLSSLAVFADFLTTDKPTVAMEMLQVDYLSKYSTPLCTLHSLPEHSSK